MGLEQIWKSISKLIFTKRVSFEKSCTEVLFLSWVARLQCIAYVWTILQKSTTRFAIKLAHRLDQYWTFWLLMYSGNFLISVFNRRSLKTEQHFKSAGTGLGEQFNTKQAAAASCSSLVSNVCSHAIILSDKNIADQEK